MSEAKVSAGSTMNLTSALVVVVYIILSTIGAVSSIMNEFLNRSGWMAIGYAIVTAIFVVISINLFLLVQAARGTAAE